MLSEITLMYAGKWDTWPRSLTFTDQLVPRLVERILAAPVRLRSGDLVFVRRNVAELGPLETALLRQIQSSGSLCSLGGVRGVKGVGFFPPQDSLPGERVVQLTVNLSGGF